MKGYYTGNQEQTNDHKHHPSTGNRSGLDHDQGTLRRQDITMTGVTMMNAIQNQITELDNIRGTRGSHFDLAREVEDLGFVVVPDYDNNERSEIKLSGCWNPDGSDVVVGEIIGDADAEIV